MGPTTPKQFGAKRSRHALRSFSGALTATTSSPTDLAVPLALPRAKLTIEKFVPASHWHCGVALVGRERWGAGSVDARKLPPQPYACPGRALLPMDKAGDHPRRGAAAASTPASSCAQIPVYCHNEASASTANTSPGPPLFSPAIDANDPVDVSVQPH